jgi:hypothetical protein
MLFAAIEPPLDHRVLLERDRWLLRERPQRMEADDESNRGDCEALARRARVR